MVLYIDETEDEQRFYVAGLLVESPEKVDSSFRRFKKSIQNFRINPNVKAKIFTEFKAALLDRRHQRIKIKMLEEIGLSGEAVYYSCFFKQGEFKQDLKERTYIALVENIVSHIPIDIDIVFDRFNKTDFEAKIIKHMNNKANVKSIKPGDSQAYSGLKYVDNVCSCIRLYEADADEFGFYSFISEITNKI